MFKKIEISEEEINFFKNTDERMRLLIEFIGEIDWEYIPDPFIALINSIIYQLEQEPSKEEFNQYKEKFSPYNTVAAFYLWEVTVQNLFRYRDITDVKNT